LVIALPTAFWPEFAGRVAGEDISQPVTSAPQWQTQAMPRMGDFEVIGACGLN